MSEELERSKFADQSLTVDLEVQPQETPIDGQVSLRAIPNSGRIDEYTYSFSVQIDPPTGLFQPIEAKDVKDNVARWRAKVETPRSCLARVEITRKAATAKEKEKYRLVLSVLSLSHRTCRSARTFAGLSADQRAGVVTTRFVAGDRRSIVMGSHPRPH